MARSQRVDFTGSLGEKLAARLEWPAGKAEAFAIFAHCFSCSKDIFAANRIARRLAQAGIAVLRFDFTGLGQSDGDFANTNFSSNIEDLVKAGEYLAAEHEAPALLVGHSLGGAAVIAAAHQLPSVKAVATLGAPADAEHVGHQFHAHLDDIERDGIAEVSLAGRPFTIKKQFLDDIKGRSLEEAVATLKRPLLIAHAPTDATVSIDNATKLFVAAKHPKSFVSLDGADHLLTQLEHADHAADIIAAWAKRYVIAEPLPAVPRGRQGEVLVEETGRGKFENFVVANDHVMLADEPVGVGGTDNGPSPYGYLTAALGTCSVMTVRMYADRKGWPLEKISLRLTHNKGHAEDCEACLEGEELKVDIFERRFTFDGDLDAEQRARLLEIADKCPVHRTLHAPVVIRTEEA